MPNKVDVVICGEVITLKSNEEEAHLQRIARYIDRKLAELTETNAHASIDERIRTLLIAVNVADDYFKAADNLARTNAQNEVYLHELGLVQEEYALLKEKFHELQHELILTKSERDSLEREFNKPHTKDGTNVRPLPRKINLK